MEKKILIAVIGAGDAYETPYASFASGKEDGRYILPDGGKVECSRYPFMAADKLLGGFERVFLIGTEQSRWGLLCHNAAIEYRGEDGKVYHYDGVETINIKKEKENVESFLEKCIGKEVKLFIIKEGRTDQETNENIRQLVDSFSEVFQEADRDIKITLDVSNGLRSIPMYVQAIIDYFSVFVSKRHECMIEIVYGMYDAKDKVEGYDKEKVAPMVRMDAITEIRKWTSAVREFYANGSVIQLLGLLRELEKEDISQASLEKSWSQEYYKALSDFSFAMNSNNLRLFHTSIQEMRKLRKRHGEIEKDHNIPVYIQEILKSILENLTERFGSEEGNAEDETYSSYMFSIAKWYFEQERFGDAVIALQEGMVTYVMEKYPEKCARLLRKKVLGANLDAYGIKGKLFDHEIRKVIRENVFERKDEEVEWEYKYLEDMEAWKAWREEYDYVCENIRNSAMLLPYQDQSADAKAEEKEAVIKRDLSIEEAKEKISILIHKMNEERSNHEPEDQKMLAKRLDYLLAVKEYDVFISYRRTYGVDDKQKSNGFLLAVTIKEYLEKKGLKVYMDVQNMEGKSGEFSKILKKEMFNSKCCLVILGNCAYSRPFKESDEYYKEIITAVEEERKADKKVFVACMRGFDESYETDAGDGVKEQEALVKVAKKYQRIGSSDTTEWEYSRTLKLREKIWEEISMYLGKGETPLGNNFVNFSNHPSRCWSQEQLKAAQHYGEIIDMPFPNIPPDMTEEELDQLVREEVGNILCQNPGCVLCQGEFTFTYRIINQLKANHIKVVAACSERKAVEAVEDNKTVKKSEFEFVGFREY